MKVPAFIASLFLLSSLAFGQKQALLLTSATPTASDTAIQSRLTALGFTVTRVNDTAAQTSDADGKQLIVISSTVGSGNIGTKYTTSAVPILNWESALYDELGIEANNVNGTTLSGTQLTIVDCTHPLAAGLSSGTIAVLSAAGNLVTLGAVVPSAQIVATLADGTGRPAVFGIEAGAALNPARIATAPARRVGFFLENNTYVTATAAGQALFDAAVAWATASAAPVGAPVGVTASPTNLTVNEFGLAAFAVGFTGAPPITVQWQRSDGAGGFTNIPGATCPSYAIAAVAPADSGAMFQAIIANAANSVTSSAATLTVLADTNPPSMHLAIGAGSPPTTFDLTYSEAVDTGVAGEAGNYELAGGGLAIFSAVMDLDGKTVHFTSEPITNGTVLSLVAGTVVNDLAATPNGLSAGDPGATIRIITTGGAIRRHVFNNIGGGVLVSDLTNNVRFPNAPDIVDFPTQFETPVGAADNYGVQIVGYITPPLSGNYHFYMSADDQGLLFLSTDENPANKVVIAREPQWANSREWTGNAGNPAGRNAAAPENQSRTLFPNGIPLVRGQRYFIEALMKEGGGGDNLAVAWQKPGDPVPANGSSPIPGLYLTPHNVAVAIPPTQPADVTTFETRRATFTITASGSPFLYYQWYVNGGPVEGETNASYTTGTLSTNDSGTTLFVVLSNSFSATTSRVATLTVNSDVIGPALLSVASMDGTDIGLCFDEALDPVTAGNPANYTVNGGAVSVTAATLRYDRTTVQLTLGGPVTSGFTVAVANVHDLVGNSTAPGASRTGNVAGLSPTNIGVAGDPSYGSSFTCRDGEFELIVGGSDVWGSEDHGHFAYQALSGNFDKRVMVARIDPLASSSKGGLMVRESLAANSRNIHEIVMPPPPQRNIFETGMRAVTGGATAGWGIAGGANGNLPATHPTSWLRLRRIGTIWKGYVSSNGLNWVQNGQTEQLYPDSVFFMLESCANNGNAGPTNRVLFQNFGDTVIPGASVTITQQPANVTIDANHIVSFTAAASASGVAPSEIGYQWQKSDGAGGFTNINAIGANGPSLTAFVTLVDNGAQFRLIASVPGATATSSAATVTVTNDTTPPRIISAVRSCAAPTNITVVFSEQLTSGNATEVSNYSINQGAITVNSATLLADGRTVVLAVASSPPDGVFNTLTIDGVQDLAGNAVPPTTVIIRLAGGRVAVNNQIVFEAEHFDAMTPSSDGHAWLFQTSGGGNGTFTGTGYMRALPDNGSPAVNQPGHTALGASPRLDYCVTFPSAGIWRVWVRGNDIGGVGNSIHIGLDGISSANENFRIGNTGGGSGWGDSTWKWTRDANDSTATFAAVNVPSAGSHVFNVWMREDGVIVDKILLTPDTAFVVSPNTIAGPSETPIVDTTTPIQLTITRSGNSVSITSNLPSGTGRLQQADDIAGPWSDVPGADPASYSVLASAAKKFYRVVSP